MTVASIYENGGIIGQTLDLGSTERYITGSTLGTPSFVGGASQNNSSAITFSITGLQEGDLLVLFATNDFAIGSLSSSGWTEEVDANENSVKHIIAHKTMGATVDTNVSFSTNMDSILLCAFRDVEFESISSVVESSGNSNTANPPSVSTVDDNSIVLALTGLDDDNATISTGPTGYTEGAAQNANGGSAALYYKTGVATGSEDPSAFTWSSSDNNIAYTAVLTRKTVDAFGNFKNSGIWNLDAVYALLYIFDYEADYGTPDYTITTIPSTGSGVGGNADLIVAVDANITSTDDGVLVDLGGGGGAGFAAGVQEGTLRARAFDSTGDSNFGQGAGQAHVEASISDYTGSTATYYFVVDRSTYTLTVYVQKGGRGSANKPIQLGTDSANGDQASVYGGNSKGYGQVSGSIAALGNDYEVNFTGTIDEIRIWTEDASLDASGFGA